MKRYLSLVLAMLMIVFALTGCSSNSQSSPAPTSAPAQQPAAEAPAQQPVAEPTEAPAPELDWPKQVINFVICYAAGGSQDVSFRAMLPKLEEELGVHCIVTNAEGGNTTIGIEQYNTPEYADGYTFILVNSASISANQATGLSDYDYTSMDMVGVYAKYPGEFLVVRADAPYDTIDEFIEYSNAQSTPLKMGIAAGGAIYVASEMLKAAGANLVAIEAGGGGSRMTQVLGGHIDVTSVPYTTCKEYLESGELKALCTLMRERSAAATDIPTALECGIDVVQNTMYVCFAPKGTDPAICKKLNQAFAAIAEDQEIIDISMDMLGQMPYVLSVEDSIKEMAEQRDAYMALVDILQG